MSSLNFPVSFFDKEKVPIAIEQTLALVESGQKPPLEWGNRLLYFGNRGAQNWLSVLYEPNYPLRGEDPYALYKNRLAAVRKLVPTTLVSLGPGDGINDIEMVTDLKSRQVHLQYIPVDISSGLLNLTLANLKPHVDIPIAILCDFEDKQDFLAQVLDKYAQSPILFSLLGGTIGNFDLGEASFFAKFKQLLKPRNHLLLDVPLAGPSSSWTAESEQRLNIASCSNAFKHFLGEGLCQCNFQREGENIGREWENQIECSLESNDQIGVKIITLIDQVSKRKILKFRQYEWHSFLPWLQQQGFVIKFAKCSISSERDRFGMGILLLSVIEGKQLGNLSVEICK